MERWRFASTHKHIQYYNYSVKTTNTSSKYYAHLAYFSWPCGNIRSFTYLLTEKITAKETEINFNEYSQTSSSSSYLFLTATMSIIKKWLYSRRAAREAYCSLSGRPNKNKNECSIKYHTVWGYRKKQQQRQEDKTTKLCASAIGICAMQYHHLI